MVGFELRLIGLENAAKWLGTALLDGGGDAVDKVGV